MSNVAGSFVFGARNERVGISAPWVTFAKKIEKLFEYDAEVKTQFNNEDCAMKIFVNNPIKAEALTKLLPETKEFGNVTMTIEVIPANSEDPDALIRAAFYKNPVLDDIVVKKTPDGSKLTYGIFKKAIAQFFNDDITDSCGRTSIMYQDIARDVLNAPLGTYFCTSSCFTGDEDCPF